MPRKLDTLASPHDWPDKAQRVRAMFDRIARRYTMVNALISLGCDRGWRKQAVRDAEVCPGDQLLDVCCGPGELADAFAMHDPAPAAITACDFSCEMLAVAQKRQHYRRCPFTLVLADAIHLPFADQSFDVVSCAFGLRNLSDARAGLAEFYRVLRPGGRLVVLEFSMPSAWLPRAAYRVYFHYVLPVIAGLVSGDMEAYRYLPRSVETFFSAGELVAIVESGNFAQVRQRRLAGGIATITVARRASLPAVAEGLLK